MAFKQLGTLASAVLLEASKRAAAANSAAGIDAPHLTRREAEGGEALRLSSGEGSATSNTDGKRTAPEDAASCDREVSLKRQEEVASNAYKAHTRPALRLVMGGRGMISASPTRLPTAALVSPMLLVVGGRDHASPLRMAAAMRRANILTS